MEWLKPSEDFATTLALILTAFGVFLVYMLQRKDARATAKREVRSRLAESYANFHAHVLNSERLLAISNKLVWRQYTEDQTEQIIYLYYMLNALHLEWHCCQEHAHDRVAFNATLVALMGRVAQNATSESQFLIDELETIFSDFPPTFLFEVRRCIVDNRPGPKPDDETRPNGGREAAE